MKLRICNSFGRFGHLSGLLLGVAMLLTPAHAADESKSNSGGLEGTWATQVSIRDCQSNAVLRTFPALNTFGRGETMIDTTAGVSPSLRSPGQGTWEKAGPQTYRAVSLAFLFSSTGAWIGTQKLTHLIEVNGEENAFRSTNEILDADGRIVSSGCATAVGRRL